MFDLPAKLCYFVTLSHRRLNLVDYYRACFLPVRLPKKMFDLTEFTANPKQAELFKVSRADLMKIAANYNISFRITMSKRELQILLVDSLFKQGIFGEEEK